MWEDIKRRSAINDVSEIDNSKLGLSTKNKIYT